MITNISQVVKVAVKMKYEVVQYIYRKDLITVLTLNFKISDTNISKVELFWASDIGGSNLELYLIIRKFKDGKPNELIKDPEKLKAMFSYFDSLNTLIDKGEVLYHE